MATNRDHDNDQVFDDSPPVEGEVLSADGSLRRGFDRPSPLPHKPYSGRRGMRWWGGNAQDAAHERRLAENYYLAIEVNYAAEMAAGLEVHGMKATTERMKQVEAIACNTVAGTITQLLAYRLLAETAARSQERRAQLMELYDSEVRNLLSRR